jgi:hypothetical protein
MAQDGSGTASFLGSGKILAGKLSQGQIKA